jgi:hypothetical protein
MPLSGCNSGLEYPLVKGIVNPFTKVTSLSALASGVPVAVEVAPVTAFAPLNNLKAPVVELVP